MLQLIFCHLCRSSDAYKVIQVYLFKNFKRDFLESDKSALFAPSPSTAKVQSTAANKLAKV